MMASLWARIRWTRSRTASPVIATGRRPAAPALPSAEIASLSITFGRPSRMRRIWPAWSRRASSAPRPTSTAIPAARSRAWPCAGHFGIGIFERRDDARDPRGDDSVGAGRRLAVMRARLQRNVERRAARRRAGPAQRLDLGMGPAPGLGPAAADDDAVLDDHGADRGIGPCTAEPAPAEGKRERHEAPIVRAERPPQRSALSALTCARSPRPRRPTIPPAPSRNPWLRGNCDRPKRSAHRRRHRDRADAP